MGIKKWSDDVILVNLCCEPEMGDELATVTQMFLDRGDCDIVIDFSFVDIITTSSMDRLLKLRKFLNNRERHLVLCGIELATKGIFVVMGLDGVFETADDKFVALASLQMVSLKGEKLALLTEKDLYGNKVDYKVTRERAFSSGLIHNFRKFFRHIWFRRSLHGDKSAPRHKEKDYVIVTFVEDMRQARNCKDLLKNNGIPARVQELPSSGEPCIAILVPEEHLDEAHVIVESLDTYDAL